MLKDTIKISLTLQLGPKPEWKSTVWITLATPKGIQEPLLLWKNIWYCAIYAKTYYYSK